MADCSLGLLSPPYAGCIALTCSLSPLLVVLALAAHRALNLAVGVTFLLGVALVEVLLALGQGNFAFD